MKNEFKIRNALKLLDLSELEITLYLNLLQTGNIQASVLAKKLGLNRSTTRYTLENLHKKELILQVEKNKTFYFSPENPEKILLLLKTQKEEISKKENKIQHIMGDLKNLKSPHLNMPKVQVFEGAEGVKKAYSDFLKNIPKGSTVYSYSNLLPPDLDKFNYQESIKNFIKKRKSKKIFIKYLMPKSQRTLEYIKKISKEEIHIKIMDIEKIPFDTESFGGQILIYKDTLLSVFMDENASFAYQTKHLQLTAMHQHIFETLWDQTSSFESDSSKK